MLILAVQKESRIPAPVYHPVDTCVCRVSSSLICWLVLFVLFCLGFFHVTLEVQYYY